MPAADPPSSYAAAVHVDALVLHSAAPSACVAFYRAIGAALVEERHDDGPLHWACELGPVHFAIYAADSEGTGAPARREAGASQLGFQVTDLASAVRAARSAGGRSLVEIESVPWGKRAVLADPDGRPVELNWSPANEVSSEANHDEGTDAR